MTTLRQIEANRRNGALGHGPSTPEGKNQSRRGALKHGMAGAGVVLPEDVHEAVERRKAEWCDDFDLDNPNDAWVFEQLVVASVQLDRCRHEERALRTRLADRAATCWEDDRRLSAEVLAGALPRKPALVSRQLRQTTQGCEWLLERWEALGRILEAKGEWSEAQSALAHDLLGTPPELRNGSTRLVPDEPGADVAAWRAALVAGEIARLRDAQETFLADLDEHDRAAAELGLEFEMPRPLALLRRYEASCERRLRWAMNRLRRRRPARPVAEPSTSPPQAPPAPPPSLPTLAEVEALEELMNRLEAIPDLPPAPPLPLAPKTVPTPAPVVAAPVRCTGRIEAFSAAAPAASPALPRPARRT